MLLAMDIINRLIKIRHTWVSIVLTLGCLFSGVGALAAPTGYIYQVLPLLPPDARIVELSESSFEGQRIDQLLLRILKTPSGKVFCGAVARDFEEFQKSFFLGRSEARKAFSACEGHFAKKQYHRIFKKKYFVVYVGQTDVAIDGWTTPRNETFLVVSGNDLQEDRLLRTLTHELAISLDRKEQIGFLGQLDFPGLGVVGGTDVCEQLSVIRSGTIKHALSALRAFDLENSDTFATGFCRLEWDILCGKTEVCRSLRGKDPEILSGGGSDQQSLGSARL